MTTQQLTAVQPGRQFLTTEELASALSLRPQSIRKRYMETGSYHGVRPVKLPNRFLAWPADAVEQLMRGVV
ncbi:DNA-binding protein [Burkholderia sp. JSH-S8]|nr:DNA-binding protein [Burkholderia sp. JSH-S8]